MTLARGAAGGRGPNVGSRACFGESGSGPVIWVKISQLLSLAASPRLPGSPRESAEGFRGLNGNLTSHSLQSCFLLFPSMYINPKSIP